MTNSIRFELENDAKRLFANLRGKSRQDLYNRLDKLFRSESKRIQKGIKKDLRTGVYGAQSRSRNLEKHIEAKVTRRRNVPTFSIGVFKGATERKQAVTLEFGTKGFNRESPVDTIKPKKTKYLAVPNPENRKVMTSRGRRKYSSARKYPRKTQAILFNRNKKEGVLGALYEKADLDKRQRRTSQRGVGAFRRSNLREAKALYFLMRQLDLRPTRFLSRGFNSRIDETREKVIETVINFLDLRKR